MRDIKERLSLLWIFAMFNYAYADLHALFGFLASPDTAPHIPPVALLASAVFMEIPIAMILVCRMASFKTNRLANIIAGIVVTAINGFLTFVLPLTNGDYRDPIYPMYLFFATIETVCTSVIVWQAWTWSSTAPPMVEAESSGGV